MLVSFSPPALQPQTRLEGRAGGTQLRSKKMRERRPLQTSNSGLSVRTTNAICYSRSSQKSLSAPLLHPSHAPRYSVAALVRASVLSLAAFYLSRMGSSRPLDRSRSTSAQLQAVKQGPRQPQCRQGITATPACEHHGTRPLQRRFLLRRCRKGQASQQIYWRL